MARNFPNIVDYVRDQLDTFAQRDLCRVDSLVFSCLSYLQIPDEALSTLANGGIPLRSLYRAEWFDAMCGKAYDPQSTVELLAAVAASPRFRGVRVCNYEVRTNELAEQQFSAITFVLSPDETFVAYRGTDNTLVGWKEDFNMSFQTAVPSQVSALRYLERVAEQTSGRMWTGGHSKGGNLAVYAGMMCLPTTRARLATCFSHDGPGFSAQTMADPRWQHTARLIDKTIPQSSVIGMIFENQEDEYAVVHSHNLGFAQHDPFSWEVDGLDFAIEERVGTGARMLDSTVNDWLATTTPEDRADFVDAVFSVLSATGMDTMAEMRQNWRTTTPKMLRAVARLDPRQRQLVLGAVTAVIRTYQRAPLAANQRG